MIEKFSLKAYFDGFKRLPRFYKSVFITIFILLAVFSIIRALKKGDDSDFYVFWSAGKHFFSYHELYFLADRDRQFLYPPFAATLFGILAVFPFKVATVLFALFNLLLTVASFVLSKHIVQYFMKVKLKPQVIALSILFTINIVFNNLIYLQVNLVVVVMALLFIYHYLRGNTMLAALFIGAAVCFKVTPVLFVAWIFFRANWRLFIYTMLSIAAFVLLPLLMRGYNLGMYDINQFIDTLIQEVPEMDLTSGELTNNRSLSGMVSNIVILTPWLTEPLKHIIVQWSSILLGFSYVVWLLILRIKNIKVSVFELSGIFVTILLVSAVTRTAHMVALVPPVVCVLAYSFSHYSKVKHYIVIAVCSMFIWTIGDFARDFLLMKLNIYSLAMLIGLIYLYVMSFTGNKRCCEDTDTGI